MSFRREYYHSSYNEKNRNCGVHAGLLVLDKPPSINLFKGFNLFCYRVVYIKLNMQWKLSNRYEILLSSHSGDQCDKF